MTRALALALVLAIGAALWLWGSKNTVEGERDAAVTGKAATEAELKATQDVLATERAYSLEISKIAGQHERDKYEIEQQADADRAALRAGNLRLHDRWAACSATAGLSSAAASASEPDGGAASRQDSALRIVRAAEQCDAQVRGLQSVVLTDRGQLP